MNDHHAPHGAADRLDRARAWFGDGEVEAVARVLGVGWLPDDDDGVGEVIALHEISIGILRESVDLTVAGSTVDLTASRIVVPAKKNMSLDL
ncbi:hypothetical protein GW17_00016483 [Ensete ventricosum]|nr:hypothetical protein GW17_00016483 [Ensete ventricosum]